MTYKKDANDKIIDNIGNGIKYMLTRMSHDSFLSRIYVALVTNISIVV